MRTHRLVNGWTVGLHMVDYNLHALVLGTIDEPLESHRLLAIAS